MKIITGHTGQAHVTSSDAASLNRSIFGKNRDIILAGIGSEFEPTVTVDQRKITVGTGDLVMDGVHVRITSPETVQLSTGVQNQYRMDLIVAHYSKDTSTSIENVEIKLIKGTAGADAIEPSRSTGSIADGSLERDAIIYRVTLYGNNIQKVEKAMPLFYTPDVNEFHAPFIKGAGNQYAGVCAYTSNQGENAAKLSIYDENKKEQAGLILYESGAMRLIKGTKSCAIPVIQSGITTINTSASGASYVGEKTIMFSNEYAAVPTVTFSILTGGTSASHALVQISERTTKGFKITVSYGSSINGNFTISWIAVGEKLA